MKEWKGKGEGYRYVRYISFFFNYTSLCALYNKETNKPITIEHKNLL